MKLSLFDYVLPQGAIANEPTSPRDASKFLIYDRSTAEIEDRNFYNLDEYLGAGDVLVLNDTRVMAARLFACKEKTGVRVEIFFLKPCGSNAWDVLIRGRVRVGERLIFPGEVLVCELVANMDSSRIVSVNLSFEQMNELIDRIGVTPIPPYINTQCSESVLRDRYQTVYSRTRGSVAAPTAGLHFTPELLSRLEGRGVRIEYITLHVGIGTFGSVRSTDDIRNHQMHPERVNVSSDVMRRLIEARRSGSRIIAVGTTVTRVLEGIVAHGLVDSKFMEYDFDGEVSSYIYPGYEFRMVDALITNFHLPKSTLLMLVCAFMGRETCLSTYEYAIKNSYRFYSFGDAMFIV